METWVITYKFYDEDDNRCVRKHYFDSYEQMNQKLHKLENKGFKCSVTKYEGSIKEAMDNCFKDELFKPIYRAEDRNK